MIDTFLSANISVNSCLDGSVSNCDRKRAGRLRNLGSILGRVKDFIY
jgi:hypothetical protein